jgi:hypothetical protein
MRLTLILAATGICFLAVLSCKKSNGPASNSVTGDWNFVNMNTQTKVTAVSSGDTSVSYANYITQANAGTIDFTIDSMNVSNFAYSVNTTVTSYFYYQGTIYDTLMSPLTASLPPTSMNVNYKLIGSDSMYFPNGGLLPAGLTSTSSGQGAHFVLSGDTLRLTVQAVDTTTGQIQAGQGVITLVRQL